MTEEQKAQARASLYDHIMSVWTTFRRETAMEPNPAFFELRVHPEDLRRWVFDERHRYTVSMPRDVLGVAVIGDHTVLEGHPVLRCTWAMVL